MKQEPKGTGAHVQRWRTRTKKRIIESLGGCCCICGYNRYIGALVVHHLDSTKKTFSFGGVSANIVSWQKMAEELRNCVLLCAVCHMELHGGIVALPDHPARFDEKYLNYRHKQEELFDQCPVCGNLKREDYVTCSRRCAIKKNRKIDWDEKKPLVFRWYLEGISFEEMGRRLNVTGNTIRKRLKHLGIHVPTAYNYVENKTNNPL